MQASRCSLDTAGVVWADNDAADKNITITIKSDTTYEANETVNLTLSNPMGGATLGSPNPATLSITNDDAPPGWRNCQSNSPSISRLRGNPYSTTKSNSCLLTQATGAVVLPSSLASSTNSESHLRHPRALLCGGRI